MRETLGELLGVGVDVVWVVLLVLESSASVSVDENTELAHTLTANESVTWSIVGGADQAQFEIATATDNEEMHVIQNLDAVDHEGEILSVDYEPSHRFIMTAGSDNRIKIWSVLKVLVY